MAEGGGLSAGTVSLPVKPDTRGFAALLGKDILSAVEGVSKAASEKFTKVVGATTKVKALDQNKSVLSAAADVERASMKVRVAQDAEISSAAKLRVAEAQLAEARVKYAADSSKVISAEERLAAAQRTHASNTSKVASATAALTPIQSKLGTEQEKLTSIHAKGSTALGKLGDGFKGVGGAIAGIAGPLAVAGGVAVALGTASVKAAANFETATTRLVTDAGESERNLKMVQAGILKISTATGTSADEIAKGMYLVESAGYHGAAGIKVMAAAAEGAKIGGADLTTVSDALTTVMTDYGLKAGKAAETTSKLIATVSVGKTTMEQLAGSLHSVLPAAEAAHVSLAQVLGAVGTMTAEGISAEQATQNLNHAILSLQNPTAVQTKAMAAMGLSSIDVAQKLGQRGLTGTLDLLQQSILKHMGPSGLVLQNAFNQSKQAAASANDMLKHLPPSLQGLGKEFLNNQITQKQWAAELKTQPVLTAAMGRQFATVAKNAHGFSDALKTSSGPAKTYAAQLAQMTGGQVGLQVALHLSGIHADSFAKNVHSISGATAAAGGHVRDWATIQATFNQKMSEAKTSLENAGIVIGTALMPSIEKLLPYIPKIAQGIADFAPSIGAAVKMITIIIDAVGPAVGALFEFGNAWAHVALAGNKSAAILDSVHGRFGPLAKVVGTVVNAIGGFINGLVSAVAKFGAGIGHVAGVVGKFAHDVSTAIGKGFATAANVVQNVWKTISHAVQVGIDMVKRVVTTGFLIVFGLAVIAWNKLVQIVSPVWNKIAKAVQAGIRAVAGPITAGLNTITHLWNTVWGAISSFVSKIWSDITGRITTGATKATSVVTGALSTIQHLWQGAWDAVVGVISPIWNRIASVVSAGVSTVVSFVAGIGGKVIGAVSNFGTILFTAGQNLIQGLINGVTSMVGGLVSTVQNIAGNAISAAKNALGIHSPSTVFHAIGVNVSQGLVNGLLGTKAQVVAASNQIANVVLGMFAQKKGGISAATKSAALDYLHTDTNRLVALSNKRASILSRISAEKALVSAAQQTRTSDTSNVSSATTGLFSVTNYTSAASMTAGLRQIVAGVKQFKGLLGRLVKAGIDPVTYRQIVEAGVGGGGIVAAELLLQDPAQIKQIASLQGTLATQANALGTTTADHLYSAGVSSAQGLLKGLESQSSAITKQMEKLATTMVNTLRKKLGIRSPSTVFHADGLNITAGLAGGVRAGTKDVHDAIRKMTDKPVAMSATLRASQGPSAAGSPEIYMPDVLYIKDAKGFTATMELVADKTYKTRGQLPTAVAAGGKR